MLEVAACGALLVGALCTAYGAGTRRGHRRASDAPTPGHTTDAAPLDAAETAETTVTTQDATVQVVGAVTVELSCRACGWQLDRPGWIAGIATSAICDCCGAESGIDDLGLAQIREHRRRWIEHGAPWFDPECRPATWDLYDQLSSLTSV